MPAGADRISVPDAWRQGAILPPGRRPPMRYIEGMELPSNDDKELTLHLERLRLVNFKGIRCSEIELDRNLTVLAGINGAGKSTILRALQILLSWPLARIKNSKGKGDR